MGNNSAPFYTDYETTRKFVNRFTIYGCFKTILGNDINQETTILKTKRRLKRQLGESLKIDKCIHIANDRYTNDLYILKNTYKERYVTNIEIALFLSILYSLSLSPLSFLELSKRPYDFCNSSMKNILDRMVAEGIIINNNNKYYLTDDIFEGMNEDDIFSLYCASGFFAMKSPFAVPGLFLQDTLNLYAKNEFESPFIYQHYFPHHIANDNQAHIILDAILNKRKIKISEDGKTSENVTPIKLIYNFQSGIQKVQILKSGKKTIESIDKIYVMKCDESAENIEIKTNNNKNNYIKAKFIDCKGYRRLFPESLEFSKNVLKIDYSKDKTKCLRFAGHIKLNDEYTAKDYTETLEKMFMLNKNQNFENPVRFKFKNETGGKNEIISDRCFEMISKNRLIELLIKDEENIEYDEALNELYGKFNKKEIKNIYFGDIPIRTTALEREFISMMLTDEQVSTLLTDNCLKLLGEKLPEIKWQDAFEAEFTQKEKTPSHENMQFILNAIKKNKCFSYKNATASGSICGYAKPYKLLYSQRRRKFQLIALARKNNEEKERLVLLDVHSLSNLKYIAETDEYNNSTTEEEIKSRRMSVRLLVNGSNEQEFTEAFMLMSHYDRRSFYNSKKKVYEMNIYFYNFDKEELVQDILSLGTTVIVCKADENKNPSEIYNLVLEKIKNGIELNK